MNYFKIFFSFMRVGLMSMMEYRVNYIIWSITGSAWAAFFVLSTVLILNNVNSIAGWSRPEILILTATETIFVGLLWLFIFPNLIDFSELIRKGNLDFLLIKPLNIRFLVSVKRFQLENIVRIGAMLGLVFWLMSNAKILVTPLSLLSFVVLMLFGLIIFYNIFFSITILNFWFINITNLEDFFHNILDMGRFPVQIYKGVWTYLFIYFIPIGYIATFPTQALLGKLSPNLFYLAIFLVLLTSFFSQWFWNFALKRYSSASS